mmetsp:Transcript_3917/g.10116  ORF Transcript_3917/g.10116 Transcript_3917/m.10116 type:complete len:362 (-) Transcript_3917:256-1341(-)
MPLLSDAELAAIYGSTLGALRTGAAAASPPVDGPLVNEETFWALEVEAPVLRRNDDLLKPPARGGSQAVLERAARWVELCGAASETAPTGGCTDPAALRIFERDAERTFMTNAHRASMIGTLKLVWPDNRDYHQGLGYVYSFLRLLLPEASVVQLLLRLNRSERYLKGYWFAAPQPYVRDAMVFTRLVAEHFPEVSALLQQAGMAAEAFASKWFVGLCLHVLPFRALLDFYEGFLSEGALYLFKFALSLVGCMQPRLLECKPTDASAIFALLRLDPSVLPDADGVHDQIVAGAARWDLSEAHVAALRAEEQAALDAKMAKVRAAEASMAAEDGEDSDEIVFSDDEEDEDPEERLRRLAEAN